MKLDIRAGYAKTTLLGVLLLIILLVPAYGNTVLNELPCLASPLSVEAPKIILEAGTNGTSIIYPPGTSAKISTVAPAPTPTYNATSYNIATGTYVSGTVPASIQTVDNDYFIVRSAGTQTSTNAYSPFGYSLLGSTTLVSGTVGDLALDDGAHMIFRSYFTGTATSYNPSGYNLVGSTTLAGGTVSNLASNDNSTYMTLSSYPSSFSATSETRAIIGYRSNTGTNTLSSPKNRVWNGTAWSSESEMSNAGSPVRFVRVAYSPASARYYERIFVSLSDDGNLDAYVWTGASWNIANNVASVGTTANAYRPFDVEYERASGKALLVYFADAADEIGYRIWNGTSWSGQSTYDLVTSASVNVRWISLAQNPTNGSNELALVCIDATNSDAYSLIWNGSSWGDKRTLTTNIFTTTTEDVAVAYEQGNGYAHFAYAAPLEAHVVRRTGTGTYTDYLLSGFSGGQSPAWFSLKSDPTSNRLFLLGIDTGKKLDTADWNSAAWVNIVNNHATTDYSEARTADAAWEPSGSKVLMVFASTKNQINYKTWTPSGGWSGVTSISMAGNSHYWVQLKRNPRSAGAKILGVTLNQDNDLGSLKWDGTTLTGAFDAFTTDTTVTNYESFELEFQRFGDPIEYTSEVEFTGISNGDSWSQVTWTVDSAWTTANVTVTTQLYNWTKPGYPATPGDGYLSYTSSSTPNTDETKIQTITYNPQDYRDASGNWKIKIKGVKSTTTPFQFHADWIEHKPTRAEYTSEVEFTGSSNTQTWYQLARTLDSAWSAGSVTVTIQTYNYTLSGYPTSGNGYESYTSSAIANTDETKNQTITTNPTSFRNATGYWKTKIKGVKNTAAQFDFKVDWVEFKPSHYVEYSVSTEFLFSSMTKNTPTQLNFTVVSEYDVASVSVTIQTWNYSSSSYVISGQGYQTYTSGGSNETKLLSINTSPESYTSNGNARIRITGVFSTTTQHQQKANQVRLVYSYNSSSNYNYVLKIINQVSDSWKIRLRAYSQSNIARLNNCTIYFRNASDGTSGQIYVIGGNYTQQTGSWCDLPSSPAERYVAVTLDSGNSEVSCVYVYLDILVPEKTTYIQYVLTFEIT